ncbi:MAG: UPF0262 family protein [Rhodospirillaceae bacterium]|nr:UPF0262 family protein [Rhodospirillaceae bacterium]
MAEPPAPLSRDPRLIDVQLVERNLVRRSAEAEHERKVAIFDLIESNSFEPKVEHRGPYRLLLSAEETRLIFDVRDSEGGELARVPLALQPFRGIVKDYFKVCESYYQAIKSATPARIEAIDMGRRGLHDEGSRLLQSELAGRIDLDHDTARRLFTLLCVLHIRG